LPAFDLKGSGTNQIDIAAKITSKAGLAYPTVVFGEV